jgi:hypothetical protein
MGTAMDASGTALCGDLSAAHLHPLQIRQRV